MGGGGGGAATVDIIDLPTNTIEALESRTRKFLTRKEYNNIQNSDNHPCKRLLTDMNII